MYHSVLHYSTVYYSVLQYSIVYHSRVYRSTLQYVTVHVDYHTAVYYLEENLALVTEGAMQQNCQTTYKLLETNLAILQWGEEKGDGVQQNEGDHMLSIVKYKYMMT